MGTAAFERGQEDKDDSDNDEVVTPYLEDVVKDDLLLQFPSFHANYKMDSSMEHENTEAVSVLKLTKAEPRCTSWLKKHLTYTNGTDIATDSPSVTWLKLWCSIWSVPEVPSLPKESFQEKDRDRSLA